MNICNISVEKENSRGLSEAYKAYFPKIYKYVLYRVSDHSTAEDLVSEVFEKVLRNYHTFDPGKGKFSTWLFTIANNAVINYYRMNNRNTDPADPEKLEANYRLEDLIVNQELTEFLLKAIKHLDERQRNIIAFKFGACLSNRQIAEMTNISESNVGTILYRSLKKLKHILKEQGVIY